MILKILILLICLASEILIYSNMNTAEHKKQEDESIISPNPFWQAPCTQPPDGPTTNAGFTFENIVSEDRSDLKPANYVIRDLNLNENTPDELVVDETMYNEPEIDTAHTCRICHSQNEKSHIAGDSIFGFENRPRIPNMDIQNQANQIDECSLIELVNIPNRYKSHVYLNYLCLPVHLHCVLFSISVYSNLHLDWLNNMPFDRIIQQFGARHLAIKALSEFIWLNIFIKVIKSASGAAIRVNGIEIQPNANLVTKYLSGFLCYGLPREIRNKLVMKIVTEETNAYSTNLLKTTNNPKAWKDMFANPYIYFIRIRGTFRRIISATQLEIQNVIVEEISKILEEIFRDLRADLWGIRTLQVGMIVHILHYLNIKHIKEYNSTKYRKLKTVIGLFIMSQQTLFDFQVVIYKIGKIANFWLKRGIDRCKNEVLTIIKIFELLNLFQKINSSAELKVLMFFVAKVTFDAPLDYIPLFCYMLFEQGFMKYKSIKMGFSNVFFIKRLLVMQNSISKMWYQECLKEEFISSVKPFGMLIGKYDIHSVWNKHYEAYLKIIHKETGVWNGEAVEKTCDFLESIYEEMNRIKDFHNEVKQKYNSLK